MAKLDAFFLVFGAIVGCATTGNSALGDAGADATSAGASQSQDGGAEETGSSEAADGGALDGAGPTKPLACPPGSVANFSPTWKPPKALHAAACSVPQSQLAVDCAFDPSTKPAACDEFFGDAGNSACMLCVLSDDFDTTYGPVVMNGVYAVLNLGGCIAALSGNTAASSCGAKVQAITECQQHACKGCPDPAAGGKALSDYLECQKAASSTVCSSYVSAASCADPLIQPGGVAAACAEGNNAFLDRAHALARLFCTP